MLKKREKLGRKVYVVVMRARGFFMISHIKELLYIALVLIAVLIGHYTTIKGQGANVQCFAPIDINK